MGKKRKRTSSRPRVISQKKKKRKLNSITHSKNSFRMWDGRANALQQYSLLGIKSNPNDYLKRDKIRQEVLVNSIPPTISKRRKLFDFLPVNKKILTRKQIKRQMKKDVFLRLRRLEKKYGRNFEKMEMDIRVNYLQDSAKKLENKFKWMDKIEYNRRLLAIHLYKNDYKKMINDKVINWRELEVEEMKKEIEEFKKNQLTKEHNDLLKNSK